MLPRYIVPTLASSSVGKLENAIPLPAQNKPDVVKTLFANTLLVAVRFEVVMFPRTVKLPIGDTERFQAVLVES